MSPVIKRIGIQGYEVLNQQSKTGMVLIEVRPLKEPQQCICCGDHKLYSKGPYQRRTRHLDCFGFRTELLVHTRRYHCQSCGKSFIPELPGIVKWRHSTEPYRRQIFEDHQDGISGKGLAEREQIGSATVERIYQQFTELKARERQSLNCPQTLGIDEHTLHRGYQMVTTLCDLKNHRVFDLVEGRSNQDLTAYFSKLKGREQVKVVCIDLSSSYRRLIRRFFPNARIVSDRFHVIRIVQHHFMNLFKQIAPEINRHRGRLAALRKRPEKLTSYQKELLEELFEQHPALKPLYDKQLELRELLNIKSRTKKSCQKHLPRLLQVIEELSDSLLDPLQTLAQTLKRWLEPIVCMWRFTRSNGITEGFHRKMKLIQRRAYGFKNFNNYRLRVIAQCG